VRERVRERDLFQKRGRERKEGRRVRNIEKMKREREDLDGRRRTSISCFL